MTIPSHFAPSTTWGRWICDMAQRSDAELAADDVAQVNLCCAEGLPGTDNSLLGACLKKVDDWAALVDRYTRYSYPCFEKNPDRFQGSEARFRAMAMCECLPRYVGVQYNFAFNEGEYDAGDSRNLFVHGILTGFGGTCVSMPVLYTAIGARLGYPITMAEARDHYFCRWDGDSGEHFCFDATSRGCTPRNEDYYRSWPAPITPEQELKFGYIRSLSRREELATFAGTRGNCLFDNFRFRAAIEAYYLAHRLAPEKACLHHAWGLAHYSVELLTRLKNLPNEFRYIPIEEAIVSAAAQLRGPNVDHFRKPAVENVLRILGMYQRRGRAAISDRAIQELVAS